MATPLYRGVHAFVIDNALANPDALVQFATRTKSAFARSPATPHPGTELRLADSMSAKFDNFFRLHLRKFFDARRTLASTARLSLTTLHPDELSAAHWLPRNDDPGLPTDECLVSCVLYLFHDEALGGTGFYAPKQSMNAMNKARADQRRLTSDQYAAKYKLARGYCVDSNDLFDLVRIVPPKFNRLVCYDGAIFHSEHIAAPETLADDPQRGRLTLNGYFHCKRNATRFANRWNG